MNTFRKLFALGIAPLLGALWCQPALAEPLMTIFSFSQSGYDDTATNEVIVTVTRTDQDQATEDQQFTVNCQITGGDAVPSRDYNLGFNGGVWSLGKLTFPPGVHQLAFAVYTYKTTGANKTLRLALSDPDGPAPAVTGTNAVSTVTIVNQ
jgi:hypothetical protein